MTEASDAAKLGPVKIGPLFGRAVFDPKRRVVKYRGKTVARFDQVRQLRVLEYITPYEEEQLLNLHPDVEKEPRYAELWLDMVNGSSTKVASEEQGGLLLAQAAEAAARIGVPVATQRCLMDAHGRT